MMTTTDAIDIFHIEFPERKVRAIFDDDDRFALVAPAFIGDKNNTLFSVNKISGELRVLNPTEDIQRFNNMLESKLIKEYK